MDTLSVDTKSSLANAGAFGGFTHEDSDHSTPIDVREILRRLCSEQWDIHAKDVEASHRWLESFMAGVEEAVSGKGKRPAVAELMKTPGRKRVLPLSNHSIRNDPFATVLFPAATNPSAPIARVSPSKSNNENRAATPRSASRNVFSPTATTSGLRGVPSPRSPVKSGLRKSPTKLNIAETAAEIEKIVNVEPELPAIEAPVALDGAGEDVGAAMVALPLSEEIPAAAEEIVEQLKTEIAAPLPGDDKCDLSMIGEEEEDGDDQARERSKSPLKNNISLPSSTRPSLDSPRTSTSTIPQPFVDALENPKTSYTLPLNDDPRPAVPSSSAVNATTRTPGNASTTSIELPTTGASSRFGTQPQSAKTGHPSSSPPSSLFASARLPTNLGASTSLATLSSGAPTGSFAGVTRASGASVGGRLNFVGLPSLRDREGFSAASLGAGGLLGRAGSLGGAVQSGFRPTLSTNATTLKRKSINGTDEANKIGRVNEATSGEELRSRASQGGQQLGRSERMESLKSKLQSMGGGRLPPSPVAAAASTRNTLGGAIHSSIPSAPLPLPIPHLDSPRLVAHAAAALSPLIKSPLNKLVRQNSVTELVSSFEKYPDDRIPSPSKLPTSVKASVSHFNHLSPVVSPRSPKRVPTASLARAMSPSPLSPTRMTLRSPKAVPALPLSPRNGKQSQRIFEQAAAAQVSTTPKGSPTKPVVVERDEARSILQQMEIADEDDTEEILLPASTATKNTQQLADANLLADDAEEDVTALLPPLPARLEQNSPDDELSMNGEVVVERDRGGLAGEFEIRLVDDEEEEIVSAVKTVVVKASPVKVTLPGSLPTDDVDASFEMIQPFFNRTNDAGPSGKTVSKKNSLASLNSESSSQNGTSSFMSKFGKKGGKVEVKSIQLAAAAAKKDAQERERKADLKEKNEKRRAFAIQKKADEDQRKVEEERNVERKIREEAAAQLAAASLKSKLVRQKSKLDMSEPEPTKKRKVEVSEAKRPETKKARDPSSRPGSAQANYSNATASSSRAPVTSANLLKNSGTSGSMVGVKYMNDQVRTTTAPLNTSKGASVNPFAPKISSAHHSVAAASSHRPPPPRPAPRVVPVEVEEEIILPDIASEYSNSDDEDHDAKVKALPAWAQSPALADALYRQQFINPDDVFGPIPPLEMGEIFRSKSTRISKRTSSANWEGVDALTEAEQLRYNRMMGFVTLPPSDLR